MQQNFFYAKDGKTYAIGVRLNSHGDRVGMWYLGPNNKRVVLDEEKMIHLKTHPPKGSAPKAVVWSYKDHPSSFRVHVHSKGLDVTKVFYCMSEKDLKQKVLYWASKQFNLDISELGNYLKTHPEHYTVQRLT